MPRPTLTRRDALRMSAAGLAGAAGLGAAGLGAAGLGAALAQEGEIVVVATGGAFEKALREQFYDPFTRATGVRVRAVAASNAETWTKLRAMQQTGRAEWDVVTAYPEDLIAQVNLLDPVNCAGLPSVASQAVAGACQERGLLRTQGGVVIAASTAKGAAVPRTWVEFWDTGRFPGARSLPNAGAPWWPLMAALQADGVARDALFPLDLDRAFARLDALRSKVAVWWRTGDQSQQMFRSGEVDVAMMWSGRAYALRDSGVPLAVSWDGAPPNTALWSLVKGAPNAPAARRFLDFFLTRPDAHLAFSREVNFDTSNKGALALLTPEQRRERATSPEVAALLAPIDERWVAENRAALLDRWNRWIAR